MLPGSLDAERFTVGHKKAASLGINHPGSATFFEEPTYLDCVNALTGGRFQFEFKLRRREPLELAAAERPARASAEHRHIWQSDAHQAGMPQCDSTCDR